MRTAGSKWLLGAAVLLLILFPISLCIGRYAISLLDLRQILTGGAVPHMARQVFFRLRLPRTIMAVLAGGGLGLAGYVYQTLFKNPLAAPDLIGVASGANMGAAIGIICLGGGARLLSASAFLGGVFAAVSAYLLARLSKQRSLASVVLAGIVINAVAQAVVMFLKLFADPANQLAPLEFWSMGGLSAVTDAKVRAMMPGFLLGLLVLIALRWQITLLGLDDEEARALGVHVGLVRGLVLLASTVLVSSIVSVTGLITFIGLLAPHIARLLTRRNTVPTAVLCMLVGSILLLIADCLARSVASSEIPISILTSLMGAPFLVGLMVRRRPL